MREIERYQNVVGDFVKVAVFPKDTPNSASAIHPGWPEKFIDLCGSVDDETFMEPGDIPLAGRESL
jgi:hypothetical protein